MNRRAARWSEANVAALAQADLLLLAARLLGPPPPNKASSAVAEPAEIEDLAHSAGVPVATRRALVVAQQRAETVSIADWRREHARLFEAAGICPPNESAYIRRDKGAILADLCGFYRAFGCDPAGASGEKADHIVTELQFVALLVTLRCRADCEDNSEAQETCARALASFAGDHLCEWLPSFAVRLAQVAEEPLYRALADGLGGLWSFIGWRNGFATPDPAGIRAPRIPGGTPYECGLAPPDA